MKANIQTTDGARSKIIKFLEKLDLKVDDSQEDLVISGEAPEIIGALVELRHKFPIGYVQGWTLPEKPAKE